MKILWVSSLLLLIAMFFIPVIFLRGPSAEPQKEEEIEQSCHIDISVVGVDEPLALEEYVKGVVAGEMPIGFHVEALKAQSIAARTYALQTTNYGKNPIAPDVSAQVYKTIEERKKQWGKAFKENEKKLTSAVEATVGDVLMYEDELISAMFFSTSNGQTEASENYGGNNIPYLQSVASEGEAEVAPTVEVETELPIVKWNEAFGVEWNADMFKSLQLIRNETGRVQRVTTTGFESNGREIREILGLRSTDFDIAFDVTNEIVIIKTVGYGHGVGMSQYGAEAYAVAGWTAEKIVQHYYTGTTINNLLNLENVCLKAP